MNNLYYPNKLSKLEEYNQKLKEREKYTNNILDRFIENGSGAPKHDKYGNLVTKRRNFLNDEYNNIILGESIKTPSIKINNTTYENKNNIIQNNNIEHQLYQSFSNGQPKININNINNNNPNPNKDINDTNKTNNINNEINPNNNNNYLSEYQLSQINQNYNNNINRNFRNNNENGREDINRDDYDINNNNNLNYGDDPFGNNYSGLGILPRKSDNDKIQQYLRQEALKDELKKEIEIKKLKKEREKQLQKELDLKEDLKVQKAIEEEKELIKLEKKQKEEYEAQINMQNMINSQKKKPKKILIDIDEYYNKDIKFKKSNKNNNQQNDNNDNDNNDNSANNNNSNEQVNNYDNGSNLKKNISNSIYDYKLNAFQNIKKIKQETVNNINTFNVDIKKKNDDIDKEIYKLRKEVRDQYIEMNDLFKQLKYDINDAEQYKNGIQKRAKSIKQNLLQQRIAHVLNKNILERDYNDNMNANYDNLITNKNIKTIDSNTNLQGISEFQYFKNDNSDNNINNINNNNENDNLENNKEKSLLALAGNNVIELVGENELIPINNNTNENNVNDINEIDVMNEERKNEEENDKKGIMLFKKEIERNNLLYNDIDKFTMEDLYKDLSIIESINQSFSPINKMNTLKNNFDVDYGVILNKEKHKSKFKKT